MKIFRQRRQSGKSTSILEQTYWCISMLDISPICIICPNWQLRKIMQRRLMSEYVYTSEEQINVMLLSPCAAMDPAIIKELRYFKPSRIYIDEYQFINTTLLERLDIEFGKFIFAYGTPTGSEYRSRV